MGEGEEVLVVTRVPSRLISASDGYFPLVAKYRGLEVALAGSKCGSVRKKKETIRWSSWCVAEDHGMGLKRLTGSRLRVSERQESEMNHLRRRGMRTRPPGPPCFRSFILIFSEIWVQPEMRHVEVEKLQGPCIGPLHNRVPFFVIPAYSNNN